jgi:hypothetical protein
MLSTLLASYYVFSRLFDKDLAILGVALLATFASFHDSGRTFVGEVPGFLFLLFGLHFWLNKNSISLAGIFWSLSVVTKPSVFILILPAIFITLALQRKVFFKNILTLVISMAPAALLWFATLNLNPFSKITWIELKNFYSNPYGSLISENIYNNLGHFFDSTTLIYFSLLFLVIVFARFVSKKSETIKYYDFTIVYSLFAFLYYLRSPGWLRYIIIAELLILLVLPHAIFTVIYFLKNKFGGLKKVPLATATIFLSLILILTQIIQYFTIADIYKSDREIKLSEKIREEYEGKSVGVLGFPELCVLLEDMERQCVYEFAGVPRIGENPLSGDVLPEVIISSNDNKYEKEQNLVFGKNYTKSFSENGYEIYELK